jgi:hypothetical protein
VTASRGEEEDWRRGGRRRTGERDAEARWESGGRDVDPLVRGTVEADPRERMERRTRFFLLFILFSSRDKSLEAFYRLMF